jgi:hypothetical protein
MKPPSVSSQRGISKLASVAGGLLNVDSSPQKRRMTPIDFGAAA